MTEVILIYEENHGLIAVTLDYFSAIKWLVENGWLSEFTEVGVIEMRQMFGEEWIDKLLSFETVDKFNEMCPCEILLETKEVYDGSAE